MMSRIRIKCLSCGTAIATRVQVGHEKQQRISSVCPECFSPFRFRLHLEAPPAVGVEFVENCEYTEEDGVILNIGSGFVISRERVNDERYFPSLDMPKPNQEELHAIAAARPPGAVGPMLVDLSVTLGGLPDAIGRWRLLRNAYRFGRTAQEARLQEALREFFGEEVPQKLLTIENALVSFFVRILEPLGEPEFERILNEFKRANEAHRDEFLRLREEFQHKKWDRLDEYIDVFDHFFREYDEFNQTLLYVRRSLPLPPNPYAASTNFENTKLYYGEAFEVLGSSIDILAGVNNILVGRSFEQLEHISLRKYRESDKGRRNETLKTNFVLSRLVAEYNNHLRNASHHRWLRLSHDRSEMMYQDGGNGPRQTISYAEYLRRCCDLTAQLMILTSVEIVVLSD